MLARLLRPLQRRGPVVGGLLILGLGLGLGLPREVWHDHGWWWDLGFAMVVALLAGRRPAVAVGIAVAIASSGMICVLLHDEAVVFPIMGLTALVALPLLEPLMRSPARALTARAMEPALGVSGAMAQVMLLMTLPSGLGAMLALAVGCACVLLTPGALATPRAGLLDAAPTGATPMAPIMLPASRIWLRLGAVAAIVILAWSMHADWPRWHLAMGSRVVLVCLPAVWFALFGSVITALGVTAMQVVIPLCLAGDSSPDQVFIGVLAPAAAVPLVWRWWYRSLLEQPPRGRRLVMLGMALAATALAIGISAHPLATLLTGCSTACLMDLRWWRRGHAGTPVDTLSDAGIALSSYWRWYLPMKWHLDPVFTQLSTDPRPWGAVLDVGCGPGLGAVLSGARADTTGYCGIDLDLDKLDIARLLLAHQGHVLDGRWQLLQATVPLGSPLPRRYDTILVVDVLHYWPPAQQQSLLRFLREQAHDHAVLWLRDGVSDASNDTGRVAMGERFTTSVGLNPGGTLHFLQQAALEELITSAGFAILDSRVSGAENRLWHCRAS